LTAFNFAAMNESTSSSSTINPADLFFALGSEVRWPIFQLLADGQPRTATEVAAALGRDFDGVSKHLRLMSEAGVVSAKPGSDRRYLFFSIPPANRQMPGVVDYGICTVRVASAKSAAMKD